ncbi:MAG TPA: hypothetical protein DIC31_10730 [Rhizobiales bacterium]|nr:hypothetical protein [Hyphomicrobiales bacterium]
MLVFSSNPEPILAERKGGDSATFLAALLSHCFLRKMWLAARPAPLGLGPLKNLAGKGFRLRPGVGVRLGDAVAGAAIAAAIGRGRQPGRSGRI